MNATLKFACVTLAAALLTMSHARPIFSQGPTLAEEPETKPTHPAKMLVRTPRQRALIRSTRTVVGGALAEHNESERRIKIANASKLVSELRARNEDNPALIVELLGLSIRLEASANGMSAPAPLIRRQHELFKNALGSDQFDRWLIKEVDRLRNTFYFDVAIRHLLEEIEDAPAHEVAARHSLLVGDILMQKASPKGPYHAAIAQYANVYQEYRSKFPDLAHGAKLRQAKLLWRDGRVEESKRLFSELTAEATGAAAEEARHYPEIMERKN